MPGTCNASWGVALTTDASDMQQGSPGEDSDKDESEDEDARHFASHHLVSKEYRASN